MNRHGVAQRTQGSNEQSLLGGDIGVKNSLDRNYLFEAQRHDADIRALTEVDRIEPMQGGGYRVFFVQRQRQSSATTQGWLRTKRLVLAAGTVGSTEILLRNRDVHGTLTKLSRCLGSRYTTNGNYLNGLLRVGPCLSTWLGTFLLIAAWLLMSAELAAVGAALYYGTLLIGPAPFEADLGATNSDFTKLRGRPCGQGHVYIEGGRYPTPLRFLLAMGLSRIDGYTPSRYRHIVRLSRALEWLPPFGAIERSWPMPMLMMGRDDAVGTMALNAGGRLTIDFNFDDNRSFYHHLDQMGKRMARAARATWLPNYPHYITGRMAVPHNQGGVPMGHTPADGVVDHAGRVFGYDDLMVLDGSILPRSPGPNPALTIMAL
ncbi:MAG: GMC oxidoreductase, partial [Myxococcota bacterium]